MADAANQVRGAVRPRHRHRHYGAHGSDRLSHKLGQPVIVENIPGAGNILGAQAVARAAPDGYTFLFTGPSPVVTNIFAFKSLPYDPYRDFTAVAMISDPGPFVISVNPRLPVSTLPELLAYVHARPGQLHYAIDGSAIFKALSPDPLPRPRKSTLSRSDIAPHLRRYRTPSPDSPRWFSARWRPARALPSRAS